MKQLTLIEASANRLEALALSYRIMTKDFHLTQDELSKKFGFDKKTLRRFRDKLPVRESSGDFFAQKVLKFIFSEIVRLREEEEGKFSGTYYKKAALISFGIQGMEIERLE